MTRLAADRMRAGRAGLWLLLSVAIGASLFGWLVSRFPPAAFTVGLAVAFGALWPRVGHALPVGVLLLASFDALPGPELAFRPAPLGVFVTDYAVVLLCIYLAVLVNRSQLTGSRTARILLGWGACMCVWWFVTLVRSVVAGVPPTHAALFGREWIYLAFALPLLHAALQERRFRTRTLWVVGSVLMCVAVGEIVGSMGPQFGLLVHAYNEFPQAGLTRLYTFGSDAVTAMLLFAVAYLLVGTSASRRKSAAVLVGILLVHTVVQLTRAKYLAVPACLAVTLVVWATTAGAGQRAVAYGTWAAATLLVGLSLQLVPPAVLESGVQDRVLSAVGASSTPTGADTLRYRREIRSRISRHISGVENVVGVGFADPRTVRYPDLPNGSIRNPDVGAYNAFATMGGVGALLVWFPAVFALVATVRARGSGKTDEWLLLGAAAFALFVVLTSITLWYLYSPNGVIMTALGLGIGLASATGRTADR